MTIEREIGTETETGIETGTATGTGKETETGTGRGNETEGTGLGTKGTTAPHPEKMAEIPAMKATPHDIEDTNCLKLCVT